MTAAEDEEESKSLFRRTTREALDSSGVKLLSTENAEDCVGALVLLLVLELEEDDTLESAEESILGRLSPLAISKTEEDDSDEPFPPTVTTRLSSAMEMED